MSFPKGSIVHVDSSGKLTALAPGTDGQVIVADSTQSHGIKYAASSNSGNQSNTNVIVVDKGGNDSTGSRGGSAFLTISAALAVAQSGDVLDVHPGTYSETISIPAGVHVKGTSSINTIISKTSVTADTTLVTLSTNAKLENATLNLTSAGHYTLKGISFASTSATNTRVFKCNITIDNSGASGAGTSNCIGIYSNGTGSAPAYFTNIEFVNVNVNSVGSGNKRGILADNNNTLTARNCSFVSTGGSSSIGAEVNSASGVLTVRTSYCKGDTADVSQTSGTLNLSQTKLENSNANGFSFTTYDVFPNTMQYSLSGSVSSNAVRYMRISDATTANEIKQILYQKCLIKNMYVRARVGPGTTTDVYTLRKNGNDTGLTASLVNTATAASNVATSVTFAANDEVSLKLVTGSASTQTDIVVTMEVY